MTKLKQKFLTISHVFLSMVLILSSFTYGIKPAKAAPPPMFTLTAAEAQGVGLDEFYEGRCFRVNINLHTGNQATGGADVIIDYDNTNATIVQNNCVTPATTIYSNGLYNVYPAGGNSVTATQIKLSAYQNPGNSYTNNALAIYGYFYVLVNDPDPAFDLNFDYTPGSTIDTNIAQLGTGIDILASVEDLSLQLVNDTDAPYFDGHNPLDGAINVPVEAVIAYNMKDDQSGVNNATRAATVDQGSGAVAETVTTSCTTTNANRVPVCSAIVNPSGYFPYLTLITVNASFSDLGNPTVHSVIDSWSFTTEDDIHAPYVENENPAIGAVNQPVGTNVVFRIKDYKNQAGIIPGLGVDINTVVVVVDGITYTAAGPNFFTYAGTPENYLITIDPAVDFPPAYTVNVSVDGADLHAPAANVMPTHNYSFMTSDVNAPYIDNEDPAPDDVSVSANSNVVFQIHDVGAGVDLNSLVVQVAGVTYTMAGPNIFTVNALSAPNDYEITIDPIADFGGGQAVLVVIDADDLSAPVNHMPTYYYVFGAAGAGCPVCGACDSCCPAAPACDSCCPAGGGGGSCGGGGGGTIYPSISNQQIYQIDESSVLVTWFSNKNGDSRVYYGSDSVAAPIASAENYSYDYQSVIGDDNKTYHSVTISGLQAGNLYFFRPASLMEGQVYFGEEMVMTPKFSSLTVVNQEFIDKACPVCALGSVLGWQEEKNSSVSCEPVIVEKVVTQDSSKFISGSTLKLSEVNGYNYELSAELMSINLLANNELVLRGVGKPNTEFILNLEPQLAMSPVKVNENGLWEFRIANLPEDKLGTYKVYALENNDAGILVENLIGQFNVRKAVLTEMSQTGMTIVERVNQEMAAMQAQKTVPLYIYVLISVTVLSMLYNLYLFRKQTNK